MMSDPATPASSASLAASAPAASDAASAPPAPEAALRRLLTLPFARQALAFEELLFRDAALPYKGVCPYMEQEGEGYVDWAVDSMERLMAQEKEGAALLDEALLHLAVHAGENARAKEGARTEAGTPARAGAQGLSAFEVRAEMRRLCATLELAPPTGEEARQLFVLGCLGDVARGLLPAEREGDMLHFLHGLLHEHPGPATAFGGREGLDSLGWEWCIYRPEPDYGATEEGWEDLLHRFRTLARELVAAARVEFTRPPEGGPWQLRLHLPEGLQAPARSVPPPEFAPPPPRPLRKGVKATPASARAARTGNVAARAAEEKAEAGDGGGNAPAPASRRRGCAFQLALGTPALVLVLLLALFYIYRAGHFFLVADAAVYMPLPSEASLAAHLERCHERAATGILPLLRGIQDEESAAAALPQLVQQCHGLAASYEQALESGGGSPQHDLDCYQWSRRLGRLTEVECRQLPRDAALLMELTKECRRLREAGYYGLPQLGNVLGIYVVEDAAPMGMRVDGTMPLQGYGPLRSFCWYPSYGMRRYLAKKLVAGSGEALEPALLGVADWVGSPEAKRALFQRLPLRDGLLWSLLPSAAEQRMLASDIRDRAWDERPVDLYMLDPLCGVLEYQAGKDFDAFVTSSYAPPYPTPPRVIDPARLPCMCSAHHLDEACLEQVVPMPPALSDALEALPARHLAHWTLEDALACPRALTDEELAAELPEWAARSEQAGFPGLRQVVLRLQAPCKSRYLILLFNLEKSPACTEFWFHP